MNNTQTTLGLSGVLTIIFVFLRAFNIISWPWIWVFAPVWFPWALFLGLFITVVLISVGGFTLYFVLSGISTLYYKVRYRR